MIVYSGMYLVIILLIVFCIDNYKNECWTFLKHNKSFSVILFFNIFILFSNFSGKFWIGLFDVILPDFIISYVLKPLCLDIISIINILFLLYRISPIFNLNQDHKYSCRFFIFLLNYKGIFFFILNAIVLALLFLKWDVIFEFDIIENIQVPYSHFSNFNSITRVFIVMLYILFASFLFSIILFLMCLEILTNKENRKRISASLCVLVVFNILFFRVGIEFISENVFSKKSLSSILIDSSYVKVNNIPRCKKLIEKINKETNVEFKYLLFLDINNVSLSSMQKNQNDIEYQFAIGNCKDNTYQVVSKYP